MSQFTHLHVHTQYSILDGAASVKGIIKRAKELGMEALAITDHGNMYGAKEFYDVAVKEGVKPIIGCEMYVVRDHKVKDKDEKAGDHLVLLAKNQTGYHNLLKLASRSGTEGYYYKPRIDKQMLKEFSEGLICCSACLGGEVPQAIMRNNLEDAQTAIDEFRDIFGEDYYLELQLHPSGDPKKDADVYHNQQRVNKAILELAEKNGIKYIASNDVHFVLEEDSPAHDRLICLTTNSDLDDPNRMRYTGQEFLKSAEQMAALFPDNPEALETTLEIAGKVEIYKLEREALMPNFPIPEDFNIEKGKLLESFLKKVSDEGGKKAAEESGDAAAFAAANPQYAEALTLAQQFRYLEHLAYEGAKERYPDGIDEKLKERLDYELRTVEWMGYPGYFLIVWDFIRAAREMGVSVGPGRGSAAGSVVAYCLKITNIDPIKYDLLFERFLNPERISLPDVDIDFDEDGRADVLNYVIEKYGQKRVAQIVTFGTMAPKMAIRDVARVQKLPLSESDRLAKLVPETPGTSFADAYKEVPELAREKESDNPLVRSTLQYAEKLEGSIRQTGVHACGVIIAPDDMELYAPITKGKEGDTLHVVQFEGKQVESVGLIKMDFLGLKTLSIIKDAVENVMISRGEEIDIDAISLEDEATYELYARGETTGLFQFESPGMKKHLRNLKPNRFEDLIAMNALYRPGPMEYIPSYVDRKHGLEPVSYPIDVMQEYLKDTYGITVYQEQVMLLSQLLGGFTGGQADSLRKAMGKKQKAVLDKMKPQFMEGAAAKGHDSAILEKIWSDWEAFASYAFNKSHATCYAYVSYQTAWLKTHYPAEFMAALLSRNLSDIKKISFFMDECKRMGIPVLGPDVNESLHKFSAGIKGNVRFGLAGIKGVGEAAVKSIVEERATGGKFTSLHDFFERINSQTVNKKTLEGLILAGALDSLIDFNRSQFFAHDEKDAYKTTFLEQLMRYGSRVQSEKTNAQQSLFGESATGSEIQKPMPPHEHEWGKMELLAKEREVIGIYLSSHPLDDYKLFIKFFCPNTIAELENLEDMRGKEFVIAGMVTDVSHLVGKKSNKPFGKFTIEDYSGAFEFALFDKDYEALRHYLYKGYFLMVKGVVRPRIYNDKELEVKINQIMQLSEAQETMVREMVISLEAKEITAEMIEELAGAAEDEKGNIALNVRVMDSENYVGMTFTSKKHKIGINSPLFNLCEEFQIEYKLT